MNTLDDPRAAGANPTCRSLGIALPDLARLKDHREANTYALLIVALLERGVPMTLAEVAERFAAAGVAPRERALLSLKRCKRSAPRRAARCACSSSRSSAARAPARARRRSGAGSRARRPPPRSAP